HADVTRESNAAWKNFGGTSHDARDRSLQPHVRCGVASAMLGAETQTARRGPCCDSRKRCLLEHERVAERTAVLRLREARLLHRGRDARAERRIRRAL